MTRTATRHPRLTRVNVARAWLVVRLEWSLLVLGLAVILIVMVEPTTPPTAWEWVE